MGAIAKNYDSKAFKAPIVIGHPEHDHPAYGWVTGLAFGGGDDDIMTAYLDQVDPKFADAVEAGKFKKISASFYPPHHENNPVPEAYYLKHVGFLGGAAPAVSGLANVEFTQDDNLVTLEFGALDDVVNIFEQLRDFLIEKFGKDNADSAIPKFRIEWIRDEAVRQNAKDNEDPIDNFTENDEDKKTMATQADLDAREAAIRARESKTQKREVEFAAQENETYIESKITAGVVLPAQKANMVSFMNALGSGEADGLVSFTSRAGAKGDLSLLEGFKSLVEDMSPIVEFDEAAPNDEDGTATTTSFVASSDSTVDPDDLTDFAKAQAYATKHGVSFADAAIATQNG